MMPVCRYMDTSPHQRSQMYFPQYHFPGVEEAPPQMVMDPSQSQAWPHGSSYGYSVPCHGCCNHGGFPGYHGFRPPHGYFVPAPQFHQYGGYPSFPEAYPMYYVAPPHYSREMPRYEYDKDAAQRIHCCGCPNHLFHQKKDRGVKIEEQEPDVKKNEGNSVVPAQFGNNHFPIMWVPHENKPVEPEVGDWDKGHGDSKAPQVVKSPESEPRVWNGWFPFNMNGEKSSEHREDGRKLQNKQDDDRTRQFPFPVIWIPYEKQEEAENQDNRKLMPTSKPIEVMPSDSKFVPVKPTINDVHTKEPETANDAGMATPAKQAEVQKKDNSEEAERRVRSVPVKQVEDGSMDKISGARTKRQSLSPPKSKLPPVCLRVDPLPKRKNGNGSSRSPSPPSSKGKTADTVKENSKPSVEQGLKADSTEEKQPEDRSGSRINEVQPKKKQIKNVQVIEKRSEDENAEISASKSDTSEEGGCWKPSQVSSECRNGEVARHEETAGPEVAYVSKEETAPSKSSSGESEAKKKQLSEAEAALLIQTAYRGYEVRKWEPLKKLKQIMEVREQVAEVGNQIQALESSYDPQKDDKQRLFIGEKIMSLLLKLDTIQGLHPSFRDLRKSLARELVMLQEELDSLTSKKTKEVVEESANSNFADVLNANSQKECSMPEMQNEGTFAIDESHKEHARDSGENAKQPSEQLLSHAISNVAPKSTSEETAEPVSVHCESDAKQDNIESCQEANSQPSIELGGEKHGDNAPATVEILDVPSTLQQSVDHSVAPENNSSLDNSIETTEKEEIQEVSVNDVAAPHVTEKLDGEESSLLQQEMPAYSELQKQTGEEEKEREHGGVETDSTISSTVPVGIENSIATEEDEVSILEGELPVGVIEGEESIPQPGERAEPEFNSIEGENNVIRNTTNDVSVVSQSEEQKQEADSGECIKIPDEKLQEDDTIPSHEFTVVHDATEVPSGEENTCNPHEAEGDFSVIPVDGLPSSESEDESSRFQEKEMILEEKKEDNVQNQEMPSNETTKAQDQDTSNTENAKLLAASAEVEDHVSSKNEDETIMETDTKLLEENKQLREMMKKLMEAGNEQLTVISNLTGRVKDLERKLSTKRNTRKPGYKKPRCSTSRKSTKNPSSSFPG